MKGRAHRQAPNVVKTGVWFSVMHCALEMENKQFDKTSQYYVER